MTKSYGAWSLIRCFLEVNYLMDGLWAKALGLFAAAEVLACLVAACREASPSRLESIARDRGKKLPAIISDSLESACRVAQALTIVIIGLGWVVLLQGHLDWSNAWATIGILLGAALGTLIGMDLLPFALAQMGPEKIVYAFRWPLALFCYMLKPWLLLAKKLEEYSRRVAGVTDKETEERVDDEIMEVVSMGEREGYIASEEREMIEGVIEFHDIQVREVMTPRIDIITIEVGTAVDEAAALIVEKGHSRIPVFQGNRDNIVGILYEKDLLAHVMREGVFKGAVADVMRKPYFIPEAKSISVLLKEMRARQIHIAIVLDEYGGTSGLVTIEDLLEEIVGEIEDEYDENNGVPPIRRVSPDAIEIEGTYHIDDLNKLLSIELPEEGDYDTVGGFVSSEMGRIPVIGEKLMSNGVRLVVIDANDRKIKRLRVESLGPID